jgi:erythromycin esterase-like protein
MQSKTEKRFSSDALLLQSLRAAAYPLTGQSTDYNPLLEAVGEARFVLLGEASHGTAEFYRARAEITRRLIREKNFTAVAVEADWPDAYRVNRYVRGAGDDASAQEALSSFQRFPVWMWRNREVLAFLNWLKSENDRRGSGRKVGFYGLDLYSLYRSIEAVIAYLERVDPAAARRARSRYACFEHFGEDAEAYGYAAGFQLSDSCEQAVINQLVELQQRYRELMRHDGKVAEDESFSAEQNARLVRNAEEYYRTMFSGRVSSWNLRDRHMAETLNALVAHLDRYLGPTKVVVWEHNSHLGDARATTMGRAGELNVGQLVRERYQQAAFLVGFSTYSGTVTAASDWDAEHESKRVLPALPESYEALFHAAAFPDFLLPLREKNQATQLLSAERLERAIGVVYRPQSERISHYFSANLPAQFDLVLHFDQTHAVEPLDNRERWERGEVPETYPTAL